MEKHKVLLSFVEKAPPVPARESPKRIVAVTADGKRLVRLQPEPVKKYPLIGVLTERNYNVEPSSRRQIRIEPRQTTEKSEDEGKDGSGKRKIPRPANAFMLFANEWRKKLAVENPRESNKDISVRLGVLWKTMSKDAKEKYFQLAREVDAEHKRKYPDYVYNPKEARLRKAMREQSRSAQPSPHLSSTNGPVNGIGNGQQQQQQQPVSPLPGGGSANRIIGPWFPLAGSTAQPATAHPKPILSPRMMAAHKTKQLECAGVGFPGYPQEAAATAAAADYCGGPDFAEAQQKWHPYQNGASAYHSRAALMPKMNSLHRAVQSATLHPTWGQFCNVPFPTSQSVMMQQQQQQQRSNRQMVFLQEQQQQQQQQQNQHCSGYPEMQMSYEAKMQDDLTRRLHSSYNSQEEQHQQQRRRQPQVKSPLMDLQRQQLQLHSQPAEEPKRTTVQAEDGPRWSTPPSSSDSSEADSTPQTSRQPLPGFQQAFGSTEIGRFSRSELFASLVEAVNVSRSDEQPSYDGSSPEPSPAPSHTWHSPYAIGSEI